MSSNPLLQLLFCSLTIFLFYNSSTAQSCCDTDENVDLCYLSGADFCGNGGSCAEYSLDGDWMVNALRAKLESANNFGPDGTVDCMLELKELEDVPSVQSIHDCGCDIIFLPNVFVDPVTNVQNLNETYIPEYILQNIFDWSLECDNNLVIAAQAEAGLWGYTMQNANVNPNTPVAGTTLNSIFDGPFGMLDFFNQGGSYQGVFTNTPGTGIEVLANDANGNVTVARDVYTNDIVVGDIGIFCSGGAGEVSPGPNILNNNDILICNMFALACQLAMESNRVTVTHEICPGETVALPDGQIIASAGIYIDTLTAFNGCDSIITTSVAYGIDEMPTFTGDVLICEGDTIELDGTFPFVPIPFFENPNDVVIDPIFTNVVSEVQVTGFGNTLLEAGMIQSVCIDIDHVWLDDLDIYLLAPNGEILELVTDGGLDGNNYTGTCFTETATTVISAPGTAPPFTGDWLPEGDWSSIYGSPINGTWQLIVRDDALGFIGTLFNWSITFEPILQLEYEWMEEAGLTCSDCPVTGAFPTETTTYYLTTTDAFGCESVDSISIAVQPMLPAPNVVCDSIDLNNISISWDAVAGALGYQINLNNTGWINPNDGNLGHFLDALMPLDTFEIAVQAFDNCDGEVSVIVCSTPNCNLPIVSLDQISSTSCHDSDDGLINISASGGSGSGYTYELDGEINSTGIFENLEGGMYQIIVTDDENCATTVQAMVPSPEPISLTPVIVDAISCNGLSDGALTVEVSAGIAPFTFEWDNIVGDSILSNIGQGTYDLLLTDDNDCTASATLDIDEPLLLTLDADSTDVLCTGDNNGTATVIPNGGTTPYSFLWDNAANNQTTATASSLAAGTYIVTVTDDNDCIEVISVQVEEPTELSLSSNYENPDCFDAADGFIEIMTTGGTPDYNYTWSDNTLPDTPNPLSLLAGSYTVTVTDDNGCQVVETIVLTNPAPIELSFEQTDVSCFDGNDGAASVVLTGAIGTPAYNWDNGGTNPDNNNLTAGEYCLTITDDNDCIAEECIFINQPAMLVVALTPDNVSCDETDDGAIDLSIHGGIAPYTYLWSNNATDEDLANLIAGNYSVTVTDDNDCEILATTTVAESEALFSLAFNTMLPQCYGESTGSIDLSIINPTNTFTYQWTGNNIQSVEEDLTNISAGTYEVIVEDADGCEVIGSIELEQPTALIGNYTVSDVSCFGLEDGLIVVEGSGGITPYLYSADDGLHFQDLPLFTNLTAGTYNVVLQDANGCELTEVFSINEPDEVIIELESLAEICLGDTYTINTTVNIPNTQIDTIIWSPLDSLSCPNCLTFQANPTFTTEYSIQINTTDGCVVEDRIILIVDRRANVYVPNAFSPNEDGINDGFMVFAKSNIRQVKSLQVYSRWGEQVFSAENFPPNDPDYSWDGTFEGETLNPATFTWLVEVELLDGAVEMLTGNVALIR